MPQALPSPTFVRVMLRPYRRGEPERPVIINTRTIERIEPPSVLREIDSRTGRVLRECISDPRYRVTFRSHSGPCGREYGSATADDLTGVPLPA
jgi:hypothetical protein